jgi:hypothetical protein
VILREEGPYFTCQRCQHKVPVSLMEWDNGKLVCARVNGLYCSADGAINGSFELRAAKEAAINKREWQPEEKIVNPADPAQQIENLPASAGMYSA